MGAANEQIRVSETVKQKIERHRREGESYNDALERLLAEADTGDFYDGFGRWSDEDADRVRERRQEAKEARKERMRERTEDAA
ncbi:antitoxin VapB family protein [Halobacterium sp. NMX12-1]|uniref:Antitoxin VapB family protein n=1 Tax=Halobacterium sp. NMX12-1 TaxID=3166650 RepID=A0AAU8CF75_9EURY